MSLPQKWTIFLAIVVGWGMFSAYNLSIAIPHYRCWERSEAAHKLAIGDDTINYTIAAVFGPLATPAMWSIRGNCSAITGFPE